MIYGYIRVSTDKQDIKNQRHEILKYADDKGLRIDEFVSETVTGTKAYCHRRLGALISQVEKGDIIIASEMSRFGRRIMDIMGALSELMKKEIKVFCVKEGYELGNSLQAQMMAVCFAMGAQLERDLISQRTIAALARLRSEGKSLGRPKGSLGKNSLLSGKEDQIVECLGWEIPISGIARMLECNRHTLIRFIKTRNLRAA